MAITGPQESITPTDPTPLTGSILAWQTGMCEDGTPSMGMIRCHTDSSRESSKSKECYAMMGYWGGGFVYAGEKMGGGDDIHKTGVDSDGNAIYAAHIPTTALYHMPNAYRDLWWSNPNAGDAQLHFEEEETQWLQLDSPPFYVQSHLVLGTDLEHIHAAYGAKNNKWCWYSHSYTGGSGGGGDDDDDGDGDDHEDTNTDPSPQDFQEVVDEWVNRNANGGGVQGGGVQGGGGGGVQGGGGGGQGDPGGGAQGGGGGGVQAGGGGLGGGKESGGVQANPVGEDDGGWDYGQGLKVQFTPKPVGGLPKVLEDPVTTGGGGGGGGGMGYVTTPLQHAFGDVKAKGAPNSAGSANLKDYQVSIPSGIMNSWLNRAPISGIQTAFYGYPGNDWRHPDYTQAPFADGGSGKYKSGTADGGWFLRQPESNILDIRRQNDTGTDPAWITTGSSDTVWGMTPNIKLFQGYPDFTTGGIKKGFHQRIDPSDNRTKLFVKEFGGTETEFLNYPGASTESLHVKNVDLLVDKNISLKGGTGFLSTITSTPTGNNVGTIQDSSGTFAWLTDIPAGAGVWTRTATNLAPTNAGDTVSFTDNVYNTGVSDTNTGFKIGSDTFIIETGGQEAGRFDASQDLIIANEIVFKEGGANEGRLAHGNSANRQWNFPDSTGTVKLNTSRKNWLNSPGTGVYSYNPVVSVTAGKYGYMGHRIPDDTATISNIYIEIISTTTDASVDLDISVEYGAGAQDHATHTGSSTGTTYNLTAGRHTFIDITGICGSLAAGDIIGIRVLNNDASTTINLRGVLILETPTY